MRRIALWLFTAVLCASVLPAQTTRTEYRAFWVDTFNTTLNNHNDIVAVVNNAKAAKANAILAQVRRRGDAWYLNSLEPNPDFITFSPAGFDPLQDLITTAHGQGIEVHAFCIIGAVWNLDPTFPPTLSPRRGPPINPNHVFNLHGGYDPVTKTIIPGPDNWLTRTLLPDGAAGITFQGHRVGNDFWIDLGHPDAAEYTYNVLMHLVRNYDLDGLHFDRIRYPEISISGQTPSTGTSIGYNPTSIERFQRRFGIPVGSPPPAQNDPRWSQWRRDQVSNLVRRVYLNVMNEKPQVKISGALIAFGGGPTTEVAWTSAEAYWRVYQDWRAWTEEGILDIAMPMAYKAEHVTAQQTQFNQWLDWLKAHQYNRAGVLGIGGLSNSIEGTLRQTRRTLTPGNNLAGVVYYSMATSNIAVTANPFSIPPGQNTPARPFAEFASGLTTGKSVNGATLYEPVTAGTPIFADAAAIPVLAWKSAPARGHLMGFAKRPDLSAVDSGTVTILDAVSGATVRTTATDGKGFFGAVDLPPAQYLVKVELGTEVFYSCIANVIAGSVARGDAGFDPPPQISAPANLIVSTDHGSCSATVPPGSPVVTDNCAGYRITSTRSDHASANAPYSKGVTTITWTVTDAAGQIATAMQTITVNDTEAPHITASDVQVSNDRGSCSATVTPAAPTASDNCAIDHVDGTRNDGAALNAPYPKGVTTITWTATDTAGLTSSTTERITVVDAEAPQIAAPADVQAPTDHGACSAIVNPGEPAASDNCAGYSVGGARSDGLALDAAYPKGVTTITWTVTDAAGLTASATQRIVVADGERPQITAPADVQTATDHGVCSAIVNPGTATATDNCPGHSIQSTRSDGQPLATPFPKGLTTITWSVTDAAGLTASALQNVAVNDAEAPVISGVKTDKTELWPPNHNMVRVKVSYTTAENCGGSVRTSLSVTSNEPENVGGDGNTSPDWEVVNNHEVNLRAERSASGSGRVYTIYVHATDADGNESIATTAVTVPHSK